MSDPAGLEEWLRNMATQHAGMMPIVYLLVALMILDVITGVIAAFISKEVDSNISFIGISKKVQMIIFVAAGLVFEQFHPGMPWGKLIAGLLSLTEMISITENASKSGLPIPSQLKDALKRLKESPKEPPNTVHIDVRSVPDEPKM